MLRYDNPPRGDRSAGFYIKSYIIDWIEMKSVLKLLVYGPQFRNDYS